MIPRRTNLTRNPAELRGFSGSLTPSSRRGRPVAKPLIRKFVTKAAPLSEDAPAEPATEDDAPPPPQAPEKPAPQAPPAGKKAKGRKGCKSG